MWLKILTLLSLFCLWPIVGLSQLPKDPLAQETLRGLPGVRLRIQSRLWEVRMDQSKSTLYCLTAILIAPSVNVQV